MNIGSRGVYTNMGILGTGITSRQKLKSSPKTKANVYSNSYSDSSDSEGCVWGLLMILCILSFFITLIVAARYSQENPNLAKLHLIASAVSFILTDIFYTIYKWYVSISALLKRLLLYFIIVVCCGGLCGLIYYEYIHFFKIDDLCFSFIFLIGLINLVCLILAFVKLLTALVCQAIDGISFNKLIRHRDIFNGSSPSHPIQSPQSSTCTKEFVKSAPAIIIDKHLRDILKQLQALLTTSLENQHFSERVSAYTIKKMGIVIEDLNVKINTLLCFDIVMCYTQLYDLEFDSVEGNTLINVVSLIESNSTTNSYIEGIYKMAKQEEKFNLRIPLLFDLSQKDECMKYISLIGEIVRFIIYSDNKVTYDERDMFVKLYDYRKQVLKRYEPKKKPSDIPKIVNVIDTTDNELELKWQVAKYIINRNKCDVYEIAEDFRISLLEATWIRRELEKLGVIIYDGIGLPKFITQAKLYEIIEKEK